MASMPNRRAIVLVVDGWGADYVGPYGNTWLETPALNQLASQGMLCEQALTDSNSLEGFCAATWSGIHAALSRRVPSRPLAELLTEQNRSSRLLSDDRQVIDHPLSQGFVDAERIAVPEVCASATSIEHTQMARLMAAGLAAVEQPSADLIWIHSRGMMAPWDEPLELREQFRDVDDPEPPQAVVSPVGPVARDADPDVIQGWVWAYAAQVMLLDYCIEALLETWRQIQSPALLIVMGARGYALAEHGRWGSDGQQLYSEHLHVPLFLTSNAMDLPSVRCQPLVQPYHVYDTLLDWFGLDAGPQPASHSLLKLPQCDLRAEGSGWTPLAAARQGNRWALRTPAWHACFDTQHDQVTGGAAMPGSTDPASCQLYLKPDDRWEVNNVADRCPAVVEEFRKLRERLATSNNMTDLQDLLPLHSVLLSRPE